MTDETKALLKSRVEDAITEAQAQIGPFPARTADSPAQVSIPEQFAWALANVADTRDIFVDRALATLGGDSFAVEIRDDSEIVILAAVPPGAPTRVRAGGRAAPTGATLSTADGGLTEIPDEPRG